jgi:hypothetical protein
MRADGVSKSLTHSARPLNLERAPFSLGPPLRLISEKESVEDPRYSDKSLGLWTL